MIYECKPENSILRVVTIYLDWNIIVRTLLQCILITITECFFFNWLIYIDLTHNEQNHVDMLLNYGNQIQEEKECLGQKGEPVCGEACVLAHHYNYVCELSGNWEYG